MHSACFACLSQLAFSAACLLHVGTGDHPHQEHWLSAESSESSSSDSEFGSGGSRFQSIAASLPLLFKPRSSHHACPHLSSGWHPHSRDSKCILLTGTGMLASGNRSVPHYRTHHKLQPLPDIVAKQGSLPKGQQGERVAIACCPPFLCPFSPAMLILCGIIRVTRQDKLKERKNRDPCVCVRTIRLHEALGSPLNHAAAVTTMYKPQNMCALCPTLCTLA